MVPDHVLISLTVENEKSEWEWSLGSAVGGRVVGGRVPHHPVPAAPRLSTVALSVGGHPPPQSSVSWSIMCLGHMKVYEKGPCHPLKNGDGTAYFIRFLGMLKDTRCGNNSVKALACNKHNKILRHSCVLKWIHIWKSNKPYSIFSFVTCWLYDFTNTYVQLLYNIFHFAGLKIPWGEVLRLIPL